MNDLDHGGLCDRPGDSGVYSWDGLRPKDRCLHPTIWKGADMLAFITTTLAPLLSWLSNLIGPYLGAIGGAVAGYELKKAADAAEAAKVTEEEAKAAVNAPTTKEALLKRLEDGGF